jgi:hypothetical protein
MCPTLDSICLQLLPFKIYLRLTWFCRDGQEDDFDAGASDHFDDTAADNSTAAGFVPLGDTMNPVDADRSRIREVC